MQKSRVWIALIPCLLLVTGCSRSGKVVAVESDVSTAYESIGTLEVKENAKDLWDLEARKLLVETATLTLADTSARADLFRKALTQRLAETARKKYDAHAVINVTFWPDPNGSEFPDGDIFARGEMIRYKKFPVPETPSVMKT